jgi:hypothetical protein
MCEKSDCSPIVAFPLYSIVLLIIANTLIRNPYHNVWGMCRKFPKCEEVQVKCKKFPAQLADVQEECEEALNCSCTCQKYGDFAGIFPTIFQFYLHILKLFLHISEACIPALLHVQEGFQ